MIYAACWCFPSVPAVWPVSCGRYCCIDHVFSDTLFVLLFIPSVNAMFFAIVLSLSPSVGVSQIQDD